MCFVPQVMLSQDCYHGSTAFTPTVANIGIKGIANELGDEEEEVSCLFVQLLCVQAVIAEGRVSNPQELSEHTRTTTTIVHH